MKIEFPGMTPPSVRWTRVLKYQFEHGNQKNIVLAENARVIHVGEQDGKVTMWVNTPIGAPACGNRFFEMHPTGYTQVPPGADHVGSVQMTNGLVWHVFEVTP